MTPNIGTAVVSDSVSGQKNGGPPRPPTCTPPLSTGSGATEPCFHPGIRDSRAIYLHARCQIESRCNGMNGVVFFALSERAKANFTRAFAENPLSRKCCGFCLRSLEDCAIVRRRIRHDKEFQVQFFYAPISDFTAAASESTQRRTSCSRSASTITRTSGSVPE